MNLKELAWAAGFYDGEGSTCGGVRPDRARGTRLMMSITQTDPRVLKRFQAAVGVGRVNGPYDFKGNRHRQAPQWAWQCQNWRDVQVAVAKLWRFLGPVKREQIQRAVAASRIAARSEARLAVSLYAEYNRGWDECHGTVPPAEEKK